MVSKQEELTAAMGRAADELPGAMAEFYRTLMRSNVFIPVKSEPKSGTPIIGQLQTGDLGFLTVPGGEEEEILPIFSESEFVIEWSERDMFYAECEFRVLLWLIGEGTTLHLNPGQEIGKEMSRWEIEQLKRGEGAIDDIVAEVSENEDSDLLLQPAGPEYDGLKKKLIPVLEISDELREAFLVIAQEEDSALASPTLGLRYGEKVSPERREYFRQEFENCSKEHLPADRRLTIVDDLDDELSQNWALFEDVTPFYIATVEGEAPNERGSMVKELWKRFGNFKPDSDDET